jgi:hypothetical protein
MTRSLKSPFLAVAVLAACGGGPSTSTPDAVGPTDAEVSALARASAGWTYYRNRPDTLIRSAASPHDGSRLRTRYNAAAATQLDANGRVRSNASFPDSSLVVKELYTGGTLIRFAVMMKVRGSSNASAGGWLWAYYSPTGATEISIADRGAACASCHASGVDFTRMNDSHPQ